ncbi:hypothetical protein [Phenylobacterium sp.]|uniref:hypothetical protein n=1 Tax=Phenylobacterium sp. TaxID=1871053 RepID=UPI002733C406|nr:hypothetical protein [Phenylobacterium sp.]MDP3853121.1 hypothetical protein [Phenylobacterium sp.]
MRNPLAQVPTWTYGPIIIALGAGIPIVGKHLGLTFNPLATGLVAAATFALVIGASVVWWRRLDEAAKEAHKFAWYWGASIGMAAAAVGFVALFSHDGALLTAGWNGRSTPQDFVELGVIGVLVPQITGYIVAWVGWWISKR